MKTISQNVILLFFVCGVFGVDADEVKSVMEGDSVTLNPNLTDINKYWEILWRFEQELIAEIAGDGNSSCKDGSYGRFKDRLQLDSKTASLTITNMRMKHSGLYQLEATSTSIGTKYKMFSVSVYESPSVIDAGKAERKSVSVTEGHTVILQTDTETHGDELIVWRFGDEGKLIAKCDIEAKNSPLYEDTDESFRDRLKLDHQTGSLTITNSRTTDSGLYTVKISSNSKQTLYRRFTVTVSGLFPGAVAGIVIVVLLLVFAAPAAAAGVIYYRRKISELERQKLKKESVKEGDDVTLNTDTEIKTDGLIEWRFGDGGPLIAALRGGIIEIYDNGINERFTNRLKLDKKTGSLTVTDQRTTHSGLYHLMIRQDSEIKCKLFNVSVCEETVSVNEGYPVILKTNPEIQSDDLIEWRFGDKEHVIADIRGGIISKYDDVADGIFRGRLKLDKTTGSLTITDSEVKHSGDYKLQIKSNCEVSGETFRVVVRARKISVKKGKNVILHPETEIQKDDQILWRFGDKDILIAELRGGTIKKHANDERFRGRLILDDKTGSLIITDITAEQSGEYKLQISSSRRTTNKTFVVTVFKETVSVNEGDSVILKTDTEIQSDDLTEWRFGDQEHVIAGGGIISKYDDVADGRFRGRLKLDKTTGSLTITDSEVKHAGDYKLWIKSNSGVSGETFRVVVRDSAGNRVNDSAAVQMPPVDEEDPDGGNKQERTSLL